MPRTLAKMSRSIIVLFLILGISSAKAQEATLVGALSALRADVDLALEQLAEIHDPNELRTWNGLSDVTAERVYVITDDVHMLLVELRDPLQGFKELAEERLEASVLLPVQDDLGIIGRDIETALNSFLLAAEAHEAHLNHATGCRHQNEHMLKAFEAVRDIRDSLSQVAATLELFNVPDTQ